MIGPSELEMSQFSEERRLIDEDFKKEQKLNISMILAVIGSIKLL